MEYAPLIVNLSGDLPDAGLALLARDLGRDLSREGVDAYTVDTASVPEWIGELATVGTLAVVLVTSSAVRALITSLKAYLAREPSLVIKFARPDGMQVEVNAHNFAKAAVLISDLIDVGQIKLGDVASRPGDAVITDLKVGVEQKQRKADEAGRMAHHGAAGGPGRVSGAVEVQADPKYSAGHAVILVRGTGHFAGAVDFRIRRDDFDDGAFGANGWQIADALLTPDEKSIDGNDLLLHVGPSIVQHIDSGVYHFVLPAAGLETTMFWPDLPLLADGPSNIIAEHVRAKQRAAPPRNPTISRQPPVEPPAPAEPTERAEPSNATPVATTIDDTVQVSRPVAEPAVRQENRRSSSPMARRAARPGVVQHRMGSILWTLPQRMRVGQRERVEVRLGDAGVAESQLRAGLKGRSLPETDKLEVAPLMRVVLVSDAKDFEISSLNSPDQYMRPNSVARWDFYATPLRGGTRTLRILVSMRVKVESKDEIVDLPSYERDIIVAVAPFHATAKFMSKNWQWAAGTVLIPLLVWAATKTDAGSALLKQVIGDFSTK